MTGGKFFSLLHEAFIQLATIQIWLTLWSPLFLIRVESIPSIERWIYCTFLKSRRKAWEINPSHVNVETGSTLIQHSQITKQISSMKQIEHRVVPRDTYTVAIRCTEKHHGLLRKLVSPFVFRLFGNNEPSANQFFFPRLVISYIFLVNIAVVFDHKLARVWYQS